MAHIITFYGPEKCGKTTLGFTAPKRILHIDFDCGRERAIWRFRSCEADIITVPLPEPPDWAIGSGAATRLWATFEHIYDVGLHDPTIKTVFIDTGTQMWKADTQEYLENYVRRTNPKRTQLQQIEYRMPNDRMRAKILAARTVNKNLIISHYESDEYEERFVTAPDGSVKKESVKTGRKLHAGFTDIPNLTDLHLYAFLRNVVVHNRDGTAQPKFVPFVQILTPGWAPLSAIGLEIPEPTFERVEALIEGMRMLEVQ